VKKLVSILALIALFTSGANFQMAHADADPTIAITTPSGVVKGITSIAVNAAVDPTGTSRLKEVAIAINGIPSYTVAINSASGSYYGVSGNGCSFGTLSTTNICWNAGGASSTYTFYTDTTSWPTGSYQVTTYIKDSNDRVAASSPVDLIIPVAPVLNLTISKIGVDSPSTFNLAISGVKTLGTGTVVLQSSEYGDEDSQWVTVGTFAGSIGAMKASAMVPLGHFVRAFFSGAAELLDAPSRSIQVLVTPKITCKLASSGKVGKKIVGKCTSDITLPRVYVSLQTSTGSTWLTLGGGEVSGKSVPINVTPKKKGTLFVALTSSGIAGKLGEFQSNIVKIKVS